MAELESPQIASKQEKSEFLPSLDRNKKENSIRPYERAEVEQLRVLPRNCNISKLVEEKEEYSSEFIFPRHKKYAAILVNIPMNFNQATAIEGQEPPHGLGRIAVSTESLYGQPCGILDVQRIEKDEQTLNLESVIRILKKAQPKLVGINPTSVNVGEARVIADELVKNGLQYVVGGTFATLETDKARKVFNDAVAVIKGHGELAFSEVVLLSVENKLADVEKIKGVYAPNTEKDTAEHADRIPLQDIPIINQSLYYFSPLENIKKGIVEGSLFETDGCPFNCSFCASPKMSLRKYERPLITKIVDDIQLLIKEGANRIHFLDDLIFINEQHIRDFFQELKRRELLGKFDWRGMCRADLILKWSNEALDLLKRSGCFRLAIGVESGSPRILKMVDKKISPEQVIKATKKLSKYGISTKGFFIFGFPEEEQEDMEMTKQLAIKMAKNGAREISVFEYHPYPGSSLWDYLEKNNPKLLEKFGYLKYKQEPMG